MPVHRCSFSIEDDKLWIPKDTWYSMVEAGTTVALEFVLGSSTAQMLSRGGALVIHNEDDSVWRRVDDGWQRRQLIIDVNDRRVELGLDPFTA